MSVAMVRQLAADVGGSPRQVDKLMYHACSKKFSLASLMLGKQGVDARKQHLTTAFHAILPSLGRTRLQRR
jgi:hypothetical protein